MAKKKRRKLEKRHAKPAKHKAITPKARKPPVKLQTHRHGAPSHLPFSVEDRILLVGEGDFSFARCLVAHHGCSRVLATSLDAETELFRKYPQAEAHVSAIEERGSRVMYGVDATKLVQKSIRKPPLPPSPRQKSPPSDEGAREDSSSSEFNGFSDYDDDGGGDEDDDKDSRPSKPVATAPPSGPRGWDVVIFNFPHTGGLSTDVNRQVRHNQSLLVSFFRACLPILTPPCPSHPAGGVVLVTLFEGEPYTLWNVRDLGRHSGYRIERSWAFDWGLWSGYRHARTLGNVVGRDGSEGGGWKGEDRSARTYAFVAKDGPEGVAVFSSSKTKRKRREDSEDEESD